MDMNEINIDLHLLGTLISSTFVCIFVFNVFIILLFALFNTHGNSTLKVL